MSEAAFPLDTDLSLSQVRDQLGRVINGIEYTGTTTYITRRGRRVAAIVPVDLAEAVERAEDAADVAAARDAFARIEAGETPIPWAQVRAELGL